MQLFFGHLATFLSSFVKTNSGNGTYAKNRVRGCILVKFCDRKNGRRPAVAAPAAAMSAMVGGGEELQPARQGKEEPEG